MKMIRLYSLIIMISLVIPAFAHADLTPADESTLTGNLETLSTGWNQPAVDSAGSILSNPAYTTTDWQSYFNKFFRCSASCAIGSTAVHAYTNDLYFYLQHPVFFWFDTTLHLKLQTALINTLWNRIIDITGAHPSDLGNTLFNDNPLRQTLFNSHRFFAQLSKDGVVDTAARTNVYNNYRAHILGFPQYFNSATIDNLAQPLIASLRGQVWMSYIETLPLTPALKSEIATTIGLGAGKKLDIWNAFTVLVIDNNGLSTNSDPAHPGQLDVVYNILNGIPAGLNNLRFITVRDFFTTASPYKPIIRKGANGALNYVLALAPGNQAYLTFNNAGGGGSSVQSTASLSSNQWNHVAATFDGTTIRMYINGAQNASSAASGLPTAVSTQQLTLGREIDQSTYLRGKLDEVKIFNRALLAGEVSNESNNPPGILSDSGLVAYYKMDETSGTLVADSSGHAYNGTNTNGAAITPGRVGNGLSFDGVNDYVNGPDNSSLRLSGPMTLEAWVYVVNENQDLYPGISGGVNILGWPVGCCFENGFPVDISPINSDVFSLVVAHEINHIVDAFYIDGNPVRMARKNQLISQAGLPTLQYLRSQVDEIPCGGSPNYFQGCPQEFFAGAANQYFSDSWHTLDLALSRFQSGYHEPLNQFLFFADIYSLGGGATKVYTLDTSGVFTAQEANVGRDANGRIIELTRASANKAYRFTLDTSGNVTSYTEVSLYTLTTTRSGTGSGTVTSSPAGITCGATCSASFSSGTSITLTSVPDAGSTGAGFSGGCTSGTSPCTFIISANTTVTAAFNDIQAPTPPTNPGAVGTSTSQIIVFWTASTDNVGVTQYWVERCQGTGCSGFSQVGTVTGNPPATFFTDSAGLLPGTTYQYRVRALDAAGNPSGYSTVVSGTTYDTLTINKVGTGRGMVTASPAWVNCGPTCSAGIPLQTSITLTATPDAGSSAAGFSGGCVSGGATCAFTVTGTTTVTVTFNDLQAPTVPTGVTATPVSATQINLGWTASSDNVGVTQYRIERCQGASCSNFAQIGTVNGTPPAASFSDTNGLAAGTTYRYQIKAADAGGNPSGPSTPIVNASTYLTLTVNKAGTGAGTVTSSPVGINCGATCSANFSPNSSITLTASPSSGSSAAGFSGGCVSSGATCVFTITANTTVTATINDTQAPTVPAGLTATAITQTQINLAWNASTDNIGVTQYRVERCPGVSCSNFAQIGVVNGTPPVTTFSDTTGLAAGATYRYRVRAVDAVPNPSGYSTIVNGTTLPATYRAILRKGGNGALNYRFQIIPDNRIAFDFDRTTSGQATLISAASLVGGAWNHLAVTFDGTTIKMYINGVLNSSAASGGVPKITSTQALTLGRDIDQNVWMKGTLDEVRIYNVALTPAQIANDMNNQTILAPIAANLKAYYKMDETSGTTVSDSSGNMRTGTNTSAGFVIPARLGNGLSFNGTTSYVNVPNHSSLQLGGSMTLEAWVYLN